MPHAVPPHHRPTGGFRNPWPGGTPRGFLAALEWAATRRAAPRAPDPTVLLAEPAFARPRADPGRLTVTWVGHSTVLLQIGGLNILTDPMWSARASPVGVLGPKRLVQAGVEFSTLPPIDLVLISHNHYDHLDDATVRRIAARHPDAAWAAPLGLARWLRARGVRSAVELDWWAEARLGAAHVAATPAQHFSGRGVHDRDRTLWCGWAVAVEGRRVLFCGDTGYHPEGRAVGERFGPFDVALVPVGAYEPRWFMRPVHMDPDEAVRLFCDVRAGPRDGAPARGAPPERHDRASGASSRHPSAAGDIASPRGAPPAGTMTAHAARSVMVPIHWGTFRLTDEPMDEPPRRTREAWRQAALAEEDLWLLRHGETRAL